MAVFAQDDDNRRDASAEEDVGRQSDDGVNVIVFNELFADGAFRTVVRCSTEKHTMGQDNGHDPIVLEVIEIVKQESIVRLTLGGDAIFKAWVYLDLNARLALTRWFPALRVGRIAHHSVYEEMLVSAFGVAILKVGPVALQGVAVAHHDVVGGDATHYKIHTREVEGVLFQFLRIKLDGAFPF